MEEQIRARKFALSDFAELSIREAGELIRHEPAEHAVIYTPGGKALFYASSREETPMRVTIPLRKAGLVRGNIFVHNHPGSESFSPEDIWILLHHRAREVQVHGPERSFRIRVPPRRRRTGGGHLLPRWLELDSSYERALAASASLFEQLQAQSILDAREAWAARTHSAVRELSSRYGFVYTEI